MNSNLIGRKKRFLSRLSLTNWIIIINILTFIAFYIVSVFNKDFYYLVAVTPSNIIAGKQLWTVVTSIFTHQLVFHIFVNMISLYFLGNLTEKIIGRKRLFWLYLIAGIVGSLFYVFLADAGTLFSLGSRIFGSVDVAAVGASGAIFGLLGLLAVLIPRNRVYLVVGPLVAIILEFVLMGILPESTGNSVNIIITVVIFVMIFAMFSPNPRTRKLAVPVAMPMWVAPIAAIIPLIIVGLFVALPIGNTAHLGGLIAGLVFGWYLRVKYKRKVALLQRYFR